MNGAYSADQVRAAERPALDAGMGAVLMSRAAFGLAVAVQRLIRQRRGGLYGARAVALVGKGNNGGDGLWALANLARRGVAVSAVLVDREAHAEGLAALRAAGGHVLSLPGVPTGREYLSFQDPQSDRYSRPVGVGEGVEVCCRADVVIDAILGTGARGGLRGPAASLVGALALAQAGQDGFPPVVACDVPSGVDPDTGEIHGPVLYAELTVTFAAAKAALFLPPGARCAGRVEVVPIGVEESLGEPVLGRLDAGEARALLPRPSADGHKYTRGVLGVVAGSEEYPGAALLACSAALAAGAGMVRYYGPASVCAVINAVLPEVVCHSGTAVPEKRLPGRVQAWLLGSGVSGDEQLDRCRAALGSGEPAVVDAGALDLVGPGTDRPELILTPHAGELALLLSRLGTEWNREEVEARSLAALSEAVESTGVTVLLKGPQTLVRSPGGLGYSQADGTPWLATAGSGDVLAGVLGALLAQAASAEGADDDGRWARVAALAAVVHGRAGRIASGEAAGGVGRPLTARDVAAAVPLVWDDIRTGR
ncbi:MULTISPECIES: NAD(P)H-hydrate dehydratase [Arthrobacter]|uniref:Bifunctional NAD(P)H-hydrate repair enzyme n=2 Tax=Arthrobacter TaxID=1663 RepID=A0ABU9KMQ9_9MICC|nr:NAD(P)H-hydrate dehydratase [Arthrobacter sp. YJM1]MDP5228035.1 NAD(P)H-hydrate dehydratase [Arthrobacter sp. YJM1]